MRLIESLLDTPETSEVVRDQIGAVILAESVRQQALASAASKDSRLWALRVFVEASNPFEVFQGDFVEQADCPLVVNITFDSKSLDKSKSSTVGRQYHAAQYQVDCFARGISSNDTFGGHVAGDRVAMTEAHRLGGIVRKILCSSHHQNLFDAGPIIHTPPYVDSFSLVGVSPSEGSGIHVAAARLAVGMNLTEFAPEALASIIDTIAMTVNKMGTGELYFEQTISV